MAKQERVVKPAPLTAGRVQRYYALLIDLGIADQIQTALDKQREVKHRAEQKRGPIKASSADDQMKMPSTEYDQEDMAALMDIEVKIHLPTVIAKMAEGQLLELVSTVCEVEGCTYEDVTMDELAQCMVPFVSGSLMPIGGLMSSGSVI